MNKIFDEIEIEKLYEGNVLKQMQGEKYYVDLITKSGYNYSEVIENPICSILYHYLLKTGSRRIFWDCDAYFYYNELGKNPETENVALHGDVMVSFWTPYKYAVCKVAKKPVSEIFHSDDVYKWLIINNGFKNELEKEFGMLFTYFAKLNSTKGNLMLLPNGGRAMQNRIRKCEDRIDATVLHCFPKGEETGYCIRNGDTSSRIKSEGTFNKYFNEKIPLEDWLVHENLQKLFKSETELNLKNLLAFNKDNPFVHYGGMDTECMKEYLTQVLKLIIARNTRKIDFSSFT